MSIEKKHHVFATLFLILFVETFISCAPTRSDILRQKDIPKYILNIYHKISTGEYALAPNVKAIHVFFAQMKYPRKLRKHHGSMRVKLSSNFPGIGATTRSVTSSLHLHIVPRYTSAIKTKPFCKLTVSEVKTGRSINTLKLPCYGRSSHIIPMTALVNKWLKRPETNVGIRVRISSKNNNVPHELLPTIELSNTSKLPYFVLYTSE